MAQGRTRGKTRSGAVAVSPAAQWLAAFLGLVVLAPVANAQLAVSPLVQSGAVVQRGRAIPIWGEAPPGTVVFVAFDGERAQTAAGADGRWRVDLASRNAGGPHGLSVSSLAESLEYTDLYVGDVWLASGQSNMEWTVAQSDNAAATIAAATDGLIREFRVTPTLAREPEDALPAGSRWATASPATVGAFSAVGYYTARDLRQHHDVPVAILHASYSGSRIETWMSEDWLGYDERDVVLSSGQPERQATVAYNAMIHPLQGHPIAGFLWYQGESNGDTLADAERYAGLFQDLILAWRRAWGGEPLPFVWVQLANLGVPQTAATGPPPVAPAWATLRASQSRALALPNTAEVVSLDTGRLGANGQVSVHSTNKEPVGARMALAVRRLAYSDAVVASGPRYREHEAHPDGSVVLRFSDLGGGLVNADGTLDGFTMASATGPFVWATATIERDEVIVSSPSVPVPQRIRYAWQFNPGGRGTPRAADLTNAAGLPAAPFEVVLAPRFGSTSVQASSVRDAPSPRTAADTVAAPQAMWEGDDAFSSTVEAAGEAASEGETEAGSSLAPPHPNPARDTAMLSFTLDRTQDVRLDVLDVTGRGVATLADGVVEAGLHRVSLNARRLAAGVYVVRLRAGTTVRMRSLTVAP